MSKGHPETCALEGWKIFHKRFQLFVINDVRLFWAYVGIVERLMDLVRFGLYPFPVFPVFPFLGNFAYVDLGVEVGSKGFAVVARITVYNIQVMYLIEMMLRGIRRENAGYARIKSATQDGCQPCLTELVPIGPLPFIFEFGYILGFVVSCV
ncbi:hypothetical protein SDC9_92452 [bioreactor metagenome]|uniref:Uncharacterized protein n=1 Tax=bioreactor metagenome TaxID=1076179 RepID=A0A644ZXR2_9ZZZZ